MTDAIDVDALREEQAFLRRSLDDLDRERAAGDLDDEDWRSLRASYAARAEAVERALQDGAPLDEGDGADSTGRVTRRPFQRTVFAVALVLVLALAGGTLASSLGERTPGQEISGTVGQGSAARLAAARQRMGEGKALEAIKLYDSVLREEPTNAEALAYRGWLLKLAGLPDEGLASLDRAIAADPAYPDAHLFRGLILYRDRKDPAAAVPELRAFLAANPTGDMVPMVEAVLESALRESGQATG